MSIKICSRAILLILLFILAGQAIVACKQDAPAANEQATDNFDALYGSIEQIPFVNLTSAMGKAIAIVDPASLPDDIYKVTSPSESLTALQVWEGGITLEDIYTDPGSGKSYMLLYDGVCSGCYCGYYYIYTVTDDGMWSLCMCVYMHTCGHATRGRFVGDSGEVQFCFGEYFLQDKVIRESCPLVIPISELKPYRT